MDNCSSCCCYLVNLPKVFKNTSKSGEYMYVTEHNTGDHEGLDKEENDTIVCQLLDDDDDDDGEVVEEDEKYITLLPFVV